MTKRPVRTLKFAVVKERGKWLLRYKGVGGKSRSASKEEIQIWKALKEANEDRTKLRIQRQKYEYTLDSMRFAVDAMRHACKLQDASHRLIHLARQAGKKLYNLKQRPDALIRACTDFENAFEDFDVNTNDARKEIGVAAPEKEKK